MFETKNLHLLDALGLTRTELEVTVYFTTDAAARPVTAGLLRRTALFFFLHFFLFIIVFVTGVD